MLDYVLIISLALLVFYVPLSRALKARRAKAQSPTRPTTVSAPDDQPEH